MNINALLGTISFVLWSSFSVWFYVTNIYEFDTPKEYVNVTKTKEVVETTTAESEVVKKEVEKSVAVVTPIEAKKIEKPAAINVSKEFSFSKNSDQILDTQALDAFINEIKSKIANREIKVQITGYTCDLGNNDYNQSLGMKRAQSLAKALADLNIDQSLMQINSMGELSPKVPNDSENNRTKNRRVTITISSTS